MEEFLIYFIRCGKYIKIGYSSNPEQRLKELQVGNPHKLKLVNTMPGDSKTELSLHKLYDSKRVHGEWFRYEGDLKRSIISINNKNSIKNIHSFQKAGLELGVRQKANRLKKTGNYSLTNRIQRHLQS